MSSTGLAILVGAFAVAVGVGATTVWLSPSWTSLFLTGISLVIGLLVFITVRHIQLIQGRRTGGLGSAKLATPELSTRRYSHDYYLFVLGSGGHTKEMLMMMDDGFCDFGGLHRRYLISSGDRMSENHLEDYEASLKELCEEKKHSHGTYDKCIVTRARRVHQPLWSVPLSAALSIVDIFPVLLSAPPSAKLDAQDTVKPPRYPRQIMSNGPATGFFVALVAHILRMFYVVPEDCMRFVYVESWARISTLSLTGKLLYYTGIADVFLVQHDKVAVKYGLKNAGAMVFNSRRPDA